MFVGHFALAAAVKPRLPRFSIFSLMLATQFLDLIFVVLFPFKIEYFTVVNQSFHGKFGNLLIHAWYTHSLLGALILSALVYALFRFTFKNDSKTAFWMAALVFSHWILDIIVHRPDMPWLPNNFGNLPLLGLGLWDHAWLVWGIELLMAGIAIGIYISFQNNNKKKYSGAKLWTNRIALIVFLLLLSTGDLVDLFFR